MIQSVLDLLIFKMFIILNMYPVKLIVIHIPCQRSVPLILHPKMLDSQLIELLELE